MKGPASVREGRQDEGGQIHVSGFHEMPGMVSTCIRPWAKYFYLDTTSYLAVFTISQNQRLLLLVSAFPPHGRKLTVGNLILPTGEYIHIPPQI